MVQLSNTFWLYWNNILNFVSTLVIKSEALEDNFNKKFISLPSLDINDKTTYPYYINLIGQHHDMNYPMEITLFNKTYTIDKTTINNNKFIIDYYYNYPDEFKKLLAQYHDQQLLIKSIFFNTKYTNIHEVINLPNYSLLGYNDKFLDEQERSYIIQRLKSFLEYYNYRWYIHTFRYEELYGVTSDMLLYTILPLVILYFKIQAIKTGNVDDFNIWEYLISKGLDGFKYHFTKYQTLYMYKNINYLIANRGKIEVTEILKELLLEPLGIKLEALFNYHYLDAPSSNPYQWNNTLIYKNIFDDIGSSSKDTVKYTQSFNRFISDLKDKKLEILNTESYVNEVKERFRSNHYNRVITKFQKFNLDLKVDYKYYLFYLKYVLDNYIYLLNRNKINIHINIHNHIKKNIHIYIGPKDILYIMYWCFYKLLGITPTYLPKYHSYQLAFRPITDQDVQDIFPDKFTYRGCTYKISQFIDVNYYKSHLNLLNDDIIQHPEDFKEYLEYHYKYWFVDLITIQRRTLERSTILASHKLFTSMYYTNHNEEYTFNEYDTYQEYLENNPSIKEFLITYDLSTNKKYYKDLLIQLFEKISLLDQSFRRLFYLTVDENKYYSLLMELFDTFGCYRTRTIKNDVETYTYSFTTFQRMDFGNTPMTSKGIWIYPSKGLIFKEIENEN